MFPGVAINSRQRFWQLVRKAKSQCITCSKPATGTYCASCLQSSLVYNRERLRRRLQSKRRFLTSESYAYAENEKVAAINLAAREFRFVPGRMSKASAGGPQVSETGVKGELAVLRQD